jgi:hypothetical protein
MDTLTCRSSAAASAFEKEVCEEECYWGLAGTTEHLTAAEMRRRDWIDWMRRIKRKKLSEKIQVSS